MDSIPYALFLYLISGKMQKSNVTSFLRVVLKNSQETRKRYFALLILVVTNRLYREFRFLHNYIGDVWFWQ